MKICTIPASGIWRTLWALLVLAVVPLIGHTTTSAATVSGTTTVVTDSTWLQDGGPTTATPVTCVPGLWYPASNLGAAQWIWSSGCTAGDSESHTFSKTFTVGGTVTSASLDLSRDNYSTVVINGHTVLTDPALNNSTYFETVQTMDVTSALQAGSNTISITVSNYPIGIAPGPSWINPAGVLARLSVNWTASTDSQGFVTGGGWINSPAGAYAANPSLTGKVSFGFVAQYQGSDTTPIGQTQFQFAVGKLNFHSTSYTALNISGPMAQYEGYGTINGAGSYSFILTARDGKVPGGGGTDGFRLKILGPGGVVYDNLPGADDSMTTSNVQDLAGGSITIHA